MSMSPDHLIYVPGTWCCPKCKFVLVQSNFNASDGTVTARDEPGDKCLNCDSLLWRVSWRQQAEEMAEYTEAEIVRSRALQTALGLAIKHIEHMSAWIAKANADYHVGVYSFESIGEDMPGIKAALSSNGRAA
jgi:hypothetical protein